MKICRSLAKLVAAYDLNEGFLSVVQSHPTKYLSFDYAGPDHRPSDRRLKTMVDAAVIWLDDPTNQEELFRLDRICLHEHRDLRLQIRLREPNQVGKRFICVAAIDSHGLGVSCSISADNFQF